MILVDMSQIMMASIMMQMHMSKKNEPEEEKPRTEDGTETLTNLLVNHSFWLLGIAVLLIGFVDQAIVQHLVLYIDKDLFIIVVLLAAFGTVVLYSASSIISLRKFSFDMYYLIKFFQLYPSNN